MNVLIIGGGHAAVQLCASLHEGGFDGRITLVSEERHLPYHRPPLSKTLIKDPQAGLPELRAATFYEQARVQLRLGTRALRIDRANRQVEVVSLEDERRERLAYDHLVLAVGAHARMLADLPERVQGTHTLRNFDDAVALREELADAEDVIVIGGGFIGLEAAAASRAVGRRVTVFEAAPRLLARAVSPAISEHLYAAHRDAGVEIHVGSPALRLEIEEKRFRGVTVAGRFVPAQMLLIGVGASPNVALAEDADLLCDNGIVVDSMLETSDPAISAIGDCTNFPWAAGRLRLESIQNANDQARTLAARLLGHAQPYSPTPSFWSDQGSVRLQIVGLWSAGLTAVTRAGAKPGSFSIFHYEGTTLRAVESVNAPMDHMAAKRWLQQQHSPAPEAAADPARPLKEL